jgi:aminotransferase EvaB
MKVNYPYLHQQFKNFRPYFKDLEKLVKSGEFTLGPFVEEFEKKFAKYIGVKYAIGTNSGTDALKLSLISLGIGQGDEVITVANTFIATVGAIISVGAKPVLVDCDERFQIDVNKIQKKISKKTKAIIPVHWAGAPCEMDKIVKIAKKNRIQIIEDACPAVGAYYNGKKCGTFGIVNAFSMHPLKPLNVWGDGGVIVTNNSKIYKFLKLYRNHGLKDRDHVSIWGVNNRLQPFQAVIGSRSLNYMEEYIKKRNIIAKFYDSELSKIKFIKIPKRLPKTREVFQLYKIRVKYRNKLVKYLKKHKIDCAIHYPIPIHLQKAAQDLKYKKGDFKITEEQSKDIITLPCHQFLSKSQAKFVTDKIKRFYEKN